MTMPWEAVVAALVAAVMHAGWNAGLKGGKDRLLDAALLFAVAGAIGLVSTLFAPAMNPEAALWIAVTGALHLPYVYYLARAYELGELSHVYTIARGLPPLMITGLAAVAVQEIPTPVAVFGIALISLGILTVGMSPGAHRRGTIIAMIVAVTIALYSISDGIGVARRRQHARLHRLGLLRRRRNDHGAGRRAARQGRNHPLCPHALAPRRHRRRAFVRQLRPRPLGDDVRLDRRRQRLPRNLSGVRIADRHPVLRRDGRPPPHRRRPHRRRRRRGAEIS